MPQDQSVEEDKQERLFPIFRNEVLIFPESKKGAAAQADIRRLFEKLQALLADWLLFILLHAPNQHDRVHIDLGELVRALIFLTCRPAVADEYGGFKFACATEVVCHRSKLLVRDE